MDTSWTPNVVGWKNTDPRREYDGCKTCVIAITDGTVIGLGEVDLKYGDEDYIRFDRAIGGFTYLASKDTWPTTLWHTCIPTKDRHYRWKGAMVLLDRLSKAL